MISILERIARQQASCQVAMFIGVRDNSAQMLYKDFLEDFFSIRPDS
jgi:hypothetical protein